MEHPYLFHRQFISHHPLCNCVEASIHPRICMQVIFILYGQGIPCTKFEREPESRRSNLCISPNKQTLFQAATTCPLPKGSPCGPFQRSNPGLLLYIGTTKKNKNCRVFGRMFKMFANISPSCWNAFPHGALVSNSQNAPPLLCNGSNKRVAHSTLPTNDRTKDLILVARCLIFENW